jgi:ketosteroid isomerase-like protein
MSQENVEIVRLALNRWIEVDEGLADVDALYEFFAPDGVFEAPDAPDLRSLDEFIEWRASWMALFDDWSYNAEKILDAGGNRVVATFRQRGKLAGTDSWMNMRYGVVYTVEKGSITRARLLRNPRRGP